MKKLLFLSLAICFGYILAAAQTFPSEVWHEGKVVLLEGDTLKGQVKYNLETDLVQFSHDQKTIKTYTARKLFFFEIFDKLSNQYRQFYVLPYGIKNNYKAPVIFEVLLQGKELSVLSRESVEYQVSNYPYSMAGSYTRMVLVYTYYFLKPDGTIIQYSGKKKDLTWIMSKKSGEIKKFIKANKIRTDKRVDLLNTVAYYNSLFE